MANSIFDYNENYLKDNYDEKATIWKTLLKKLFAEPETGIFYKEDLIDKAPFETIMTESILNRPDYFDNIKNSLVEKIDKTRTLPYSVSPTDLSYWDTHVWNESLAALMQIFYFSSSLSQEESNIYERQDGKVDNNYFKSDINIIQEDLNLKWEEFKANSVLFVKNYYDLLDGFILKLSYIENKTSLDNPIIIKIDFADYPELKDNESFISEMPGIMACLKGETPAGWRLSDIKAFKEKYKINFTLPSIDGYYRGGGELINAARRARLYDIKSANAAASFEIEDNVYKYEPQIIGYDIQLLSKNNGDDEKEVLDNPITITISYSERPDLQVNLDFQWDIINIKRCLEGQADYGWLLSDIVNFKENYGLDFSIPEEGGYYFGIVFPQEILLKRVWQPWVQPWYNFNGETYSYVRGTDKRISALTNSNYLNYTHSTNNNWANLLMPTNKRKVEVEDLNRNFWVIAQTISFLNAYLTEETAPFGNIMRSSLNEVMQLWENVLLLWSSVAINSQKKEKQLVHGEFVYITPDIWRPYFNYDNFDIKTSWLNSKDEETGKYNYLLDDEQRALFLSQIESYLSSYKNTYPDYNLCLVPIIRLNNYEENYYNRIICPGVYKYNPNENYSGWEEFVEREDDKDIRYTIDISCVDYQNNICGLSEDEDEETYTICYPLSSSIRTTTEEDKTFYGLVRTKETISCGLKAYEPTDEDKSGVSYSGSLIFYDGVEEIVNGNEYPVVSIHFSNDNGAQKTEHLRDIPYKESEVKIINKGYYQGELLSCKAKSSVVKYNLLTLSTQELPASLVKIDGRNISLEEYKAQYGLDTAAQAIKNDMAFDKIALKNYLSLVAKRYNAVSSESFWAEYSNAHQKTQKVGYNIETSIEKSRLTVQKDYGNTALNWKNKTAWQEDAWRALDIKDAVLNDNTILFVDGQRTINPIPNNSNEGRGYTVLSDDGMIHHFYSSTVLNRVQVGAAVRMPIENEEASIVYYPLHTSPPAPALSDFSYENFIVADPFVRRNTSTEQWAPNLYNRDEESNPDISKRYTTIVNDVDWRSKYPIDIKTWDNQIVENYDVQLSATYNENNQTLVLIKEDENQPGVPQEINKDNWLINRTISKYYYGVRYCNFEQDGTIVRTNLEGAEREAHPMTDERYYAQVFRNYIKKEISNSGIDTTNAAQGSIEKIYNDLNLGKLVFGWYRTTIDGVLYEARLSIYNPGFLEDEENQRAMLLRINNGNPTGGDLIALKNLLSGHWMDDLEPSTLSSNYEANFSGMYYAGKSTLSKELRYQAWLDNQIILRNRKVNNYGQQMALYSDENNREDWENVINYLFFSDGGRKPLYDGTIKEYNGHPCYLNRVLETENKGENLYLFDSSIVIQSYQYVFGPEINGVPIYGRRGVYRYKVKTNSSQTDDYPYGCWPSYNDSTYITSGLSNGPSAVDSLRNGYVIVSNSNNNIFLEGYKSRFNKKLLDTWNEDENLPEGLRRHIAEEEDSSLSIVNNLKWDNDNPDLKLWDIIA